MDIIRFEVGDILEMKKKHPCGSSEMKVTRVGSDIRLLCTGCGHEIVVERVKIEKNIKKVRPLGGENPQNR